MRKVSWHPAVLIAVTLLLETVAPSMANDILYLDRGDVGFNLPGVTLPQGQDEVHAADGTTCRAAVSGSGSYLDVGAINGNMRSGSSNVATYARVVIPIGVRGKRIDCARLYELEVERLKMELDMLKMGLAASSTDSAEAGKTTEAGNWTREGWTDAGVASSKSR